MLPEPASLYDAATAAALSVRVGAGGSQEAETRAAVGSAWTMLCNQLGRDRPPSLVIASFTVTHDGAEVMRALDEICGDKVIDHPLQTLCQSFVRTRHGVVLSPRSKLSQHRRCHANGAATPTLAPRCRLRAARRAAVPQSTASGSRTGRSARARSGPSRTMRVTTRSEIVMSCPLRMSPLQHSG